MNLLGVSGVYTAPDGSHHAALVAALVVSTHAGPWNVDVVVFRSVDGAVAMHTERHAMVVGYGSTSPHSFAPASRVGV